jgi:uncharacterized protein
LRTPAWSGRKRAMIVASYLGSRREFLSADLVLIQAHGHGLLYDRVCGGGAVLDHAECLLVSELLARQSAGAAVFEVSAETATWSSLLALLRLKGFLRSTPQTIPDSRLDDSKISRGLFAKQLSLMVAVQCNYACKDCFVFNEAANVLPRANAYMRWEIAEKALEAFFTMRSRASAINESVVRIFGGEPLFNWPLIKNVVQWVRSRSLGCPIYVTTNGSLLNRERAAFLEENGATLFISLDGVRDINDRIRVDHGSRSTFDRTVSGLWAFMQEANRTHVSLTIHEDEGITRLPELLTFLDKLRPSAKHTVVVYLSLLKGLVSETRFRLPEAELARRVAHLWVSSMERNMYLGGRLFHCFRNVFEAPEKFDRWCERGSGIVVYPSGEIRPCSGTAHLIGHIDAFSRVFTDAAFHAVSKRIGSQIEGCRGCALQGLCGGSCACSSRAGLDEYRPGINCEFERKMFVEAVRQFLFVHSLCPKGPNAGRT